MRRLLNQAANAAVKRKGSIFEMVYRRLVPRLGHNKTIGAIAHRICQLIWMILYKGVRYEERGPAVCEQSKRVPHCPNDPDTPEARLPSRTSRGSGMSSAIFDPGYNN
jgi:hypothetical protein